MVNRIEIRRPSGMGRVLEHVDADQNRTNKVIIKKNLALFALGKPGVMEVFKSKI